MKKSIVLLALVLTVSFSIYAQNKIILNVIDPVDGDKTLDVTLKTNETLQINSLGDVTATTDWDGVNGFELALVNSGISTVSSAPGISFSCSNATNNDCSMVTTDSTVVTVTIDPGATYCNEFSGSDTVPFNITTNSIDPFIQTLSRIINVATSSIYSVECGNNGGSSTKQTINVNLATIPTVTISPNSQSVTSGANSIAVSWAASANTDECIFTGDWPAGTTLGSYVAINAATGLPPTNFTFTNITTAKTLSVTCRNSIGESSEASQVYSIAGSTSSMWTQCTNGSTSVLQGNGVEDRTIYANNTANAGLYDGNFASFQGATVDRPWPGTIGESISLSLTRGSYISAKFNSGNLNLKGQFQYAAPGNTQGPTPGAITTTISTCPGNFDTNNLGQAKCIKKGGNLRWATDPAADPALYCILDKNTEYFLNIIHSDDSEGDGFKTSDCASTYCGILAQYSNSTI